MRFRFLLALAPAVIFSLLPAQTSPDFEARDRALRHATPEWQNVSAHLPDPGIAAAAELLQAADVLRARRLPEDAIEFYQAAIRRGGDEPLLLNRIGIVELDLRRIDVAVIFFRRVVHLKKKDAPAWNNLGAAEYATGNFRNAIGDYRKAVKLDRNEAVFHSNLGTAYFDLKDYESARRQFEQAIRIDPNLFQRGNSGGIQIHILSPQDRGRFCFEMARLAAKHHEETGMLQWLAKSSEAGFDVREGMSDVSEFTPYRKDERVALLIRNTKAMHVKQVAQVEPLAALTPAQ